MIKHLGALAVAAVVIAGLPGFARADKLDQRLFDEMPEVIKSLQAKGYKSVGVLRFRVQEGDGKVTFTTPLSSNLPTRIENLLIICGDVKESDSLRVIHDAGAFAGKQNISAWYGNATQRTKLFDLKYPLAWGNEKVEADVFLTGLVRLSQDLKKTTIILESFDRKSADLVKLKEFTINTDRNICRDLGYSFSLDKKTRDRLVAKRGSGDEADDLIIVKLPPKSKGDDKEEQEEKKNTEEETGTDDKKSDTLATPSNVGGVKVELIADEKTVEFRKSGSKGEAIKWQVESPAPDQKIAILLTNKGDGKVGVVLRLNGVNTVNEQKNEPEKCQKWILPPGKSKLVKGFYLMAGRDVVKSEIYPFKVLVGDEAKEAKEEMGDRAGLLDVDVFEEGTEKSEAMVSAKGMPPSKEMKARESYVSLKDALIKSAGLNMTRGRLYIAPDKTEKQTGGTIKLVPFDNPQIVAHVTIKVTPRKGD